MLGPTDGRRLARPSKPAYINAIGKIRDPCPWCPGGLLMDMPPPQGVPLFATPFGVVSLPEAQTLNPALAALFAERATAEWRDPLATQEVHTFRSRADLTDWPEEPVRHAIRAILAGVASVAASINDLGAEQLAALRVQARAWFTIVRPDGCVPPASYANTSW